MSTGKDGAAVKAGPAGRWRYLVPLVLAAVGLGGYGVYWLIVVRGTVSTDDAVIQTLLVPCSSRVGGRVVELLVRAGETVSKGQVLARLDDVPYRAQRDQAAAGVAFAEAELESANLNLLRAKGSLTKNVAMAQAELDAALAKEKFTQKQRERFSRLSDLAAEVERDQVQTAFDASAAALKVHQEQLALLTSGPGGGDTAKAPAELALAILENQVEMAQANLDLARARLVMAEDNLAQAEVTAFASGQVSRRHVEPGQVVTPGQTLFSISVLASPWIEANFKEKEIAEIEPGDQVIITVDAYSGRRFPGHVLHILGAALSEFSLLPSGSTSGNFIKVTQRVPVHIAFDPGDLPPLYPGLNVEVRVKLHSAPAAESEPAK